MREIRPARSFAWWPTRLVIELQDYERLRHATHLPGERIADAYLDWMQRQAEADGAMLVAERDGSIVGFTAGWIEQTNNIGETADSNGFGYISDICVMPAFAGTDSPRSFWMGSSSISAGPALCVCASTRSR